MPAEPNSAATELPSPQRARATSTFAAVRSGDAHEPHNSMMRPSGRAVLIPGCVPQTAHVVVITTPESELERAT